MNLIWASIVQRGILPAWLLIPLLLLFLYGWWRVARRIALPPRRLRILFLLRLVIFSLALWLSLQIVWIRRKQTEELPVLAVAVDDSASMRENPLQASESRRERVAHLFASSTWKKLHEHSRVVFYGIGENCAELAGEEKLSYSAPQSHIRQNLEQLRRKLHGTACQGILLLSDGLDSDFARTDEIGKQEIPVFGLSLEEPGNLPQKAGEIFIRECFVPRRADVHSEIHGMFYLQRSGDLSRRQPVRLVFSRDGKNQEEREVIFEEGARYLQCDFSWRAEDVGQFLYRLALNGEGVSSVEERQQRKFLLEITEQDRKFLYVEGLPRWEFKFLKQALQHAKETKLSAFARNGGSENSFVSFDADGTTFLPEWSEEGLRPYRGIILGNLQAAELGEPAAKAIAAFVERGGALFFLGGDHVFQPGGLLSLPPFQPLLPVKLLAQGEMRTGKFSVQMSETGRTISAFASLAQVNELPPILSCWHPVELDPASLVLLEAMPEKMPLCVLRSYGRGRVALLLSDSFWRWQTDVTGKKTGNGASLYAQTILQLLEWLSPGRERTVGEETQLQLFLSEQEVVAGTGIFFGVPGSGENKLQASVELPSGKFQSLPLQQGILENNLGISAPQGGWIGEWIPAEPGAYRVLVRSQKDGAQVEKRFLVRPALGEKTGEPVNHEGLRQYCAATGGRYLSWEELPDLPQCFPQRKIVRLQEREESLWHSVWLLLALAGLETLEWILRRRWYLP